MKAICAIDGCEDNVHARDLCRIHYRRLNTHGDANFMARAADGSGTIMSAGYKQVTFNGIRILEHRLIAEKAIGKPLPKDACVHHVDGNRLNNNPENLVICPDEKYHRLLHLRASAIDAGFPPTYRKCSHCQQYGNPELMYKQQKQFHHKECKNKYAKQSRESLKAKKLALKNQPQITI